MQQLRAFSYGGGVQSTAALILAAQGKIDFRTFLFCNVGADSENPKTLVYVREVAMPYAEAHGIHLEEIRRVKKDGIPETVLERTMNNTRSISIPVRGMNGAPVFRRKCTMDFKIRVIVKWLKAHGATKDNPALTGLGISVDEAQRMKVDSGEPVQLLAYPLLDLGLSRRDCIRIIEEARLPVPPKSSCYFCPFHKSSEWLRMKREEPELYRKSVELERAINAKQAEMGQRPVWLTRYARPMDEIMELLDTQMSFDGLWSDEDDNCESGYCMT